MKCITAVYMFLFGDGLKEISYFVLLVFGFISPRQDGDGSGSLDLRESQLCPDPQRPGGSACEPHKPDRLPLPP